MSPALHWLRKAAVTAAAGVLGLSLLPTAAQAQVSAGQPLAPSSVRAAESEQFSS